MRVGLFGNGYDGQEAVRNVRALQRARGRTLDAADEAGRRRARTLSDLQSTASQTSLGLVNILV